MSLLAPWTLNAIYWLIELKWGGGKGGEAALPWAWRARLRQGSAAGVEGKAAGRTAQREASR